MLTKERCDECIKVFSDAIFWDSSDELKDGYEVSPDEAELFAYRLLHAVKRARENRDE